MKICNSCGAQNDDGNKNCTACGSAFEVVSQDNGLNAGQEASYAYQPGYNQPQYSYPQQDFNQAQYNYNQNQYAYSQGQWDYNQQQMNYGQATPSGNGKKKKMILISVVALVAIIGIIILACKLISDKKEKEDNQKPRKMAQKVFDAYNDCDEDYLLSITPDFKEEDIEDAIELVEDYEITIDIISLGKADFMSKAEIRELQEDIEDDYSEKVYIQKACTIEAEAEVTMYFYGDDYSDEDTLELVFYKSKDKWYLLHDGIH